MKCNQICPYNTLKGCVVMDRNGACPLSVSELLGMSEQLVRTNDILVRGKQEYEVVIADDNIFVICPIVYSKTEQSKIVKYDKAEIYANQSSINTLEELRFEKMDIKVFERDKEDGRLVFKALNFEVMMHDLIETMPPESKKELEFMIMQMVDSIQMVASEHYKDNFDNQDEWEDIYYR